MITTLGPKKNYQAVHKEVFLKELTYKHRRLRTGRVFAKQTIFSTNLGKGPLSEGGS